jgi:ADP-ribose pyrophosphatase
MVDPGENVSVTLKREFGEEALNSLEIEEEKRQKLQKRISEFFTNGYEVSVKFIGHC